MFYQPKDGHGLPHDPFSAIISPRPIAWISTRDKAGRENLAPYSFFNAVAYTPPQVMFASTSTKADRDHGKDTLSIIRETGEFCVNIVSRNLADLMNATSKSFAADEDEFDMAGVERAPCAVINASRVAAAPAALECRLTQIVTLPGASNSVIFGEVVGVYLNDDCVVDGEFDVLRYRPLARLGYKDYASVDAKFSLNRPGE